MKEKDEVGKKERHLNWEFFHLPRENLQTLSILPAYCFLKSDNLSLSPTLQSWPRPSVTHSFTFVYQTHVLLY